ncbi:CDP-diacylglycerol--glycerol-3-phosphate 3-phosphatidyltransferase [Acuticoccus sp.]|uniref:CDP-diacylglycerol--glycerol-3-phosphate 3-phosphatidyltransferase n=1 Tax=Acuticoccus sp. TaxID=1904378 RepID=UPI003B528CD1
MNIPTALTTFRCVAVLAIAVALLWPFGALRGVALVLFVAAALTDWFDGYLARRWRQVTPFGRMLDSIADKMLVAVVLLVLCADGTIEGLNALAAAMILTREIAIAGLREHLAAQSVVVASTLLAKWKTTVQLVAIAVLIGAPLTGLPVIATSVGLAILWVATLMTVVSGVQYAAATRGHFANEA